MYHGFFINLGANDERRRALTSHFVERGLADRYRRVEAVNGRSAPQRSQTALDPGSLGLWLTHLNLLESQRDTAAHLHIIEDDTVFAAAAAGRFDTFLDHADANFADWDLIFTDIHVPSDDVGVFRSLAQLMNDFQTTGNLALLNLRQTMFSCTSSMFLNRRSIAKYSQLLADGWKHGAPIDTFLRNLVRQGLLNAYLTVPFQTSVSTAAIASDIRGTLDASRVAATVYRRAFFEDADLAALDAELQRLIQGTTLSPLAAIYIKSLIFKLSDQWKPF